MKTLDNESKEFIKRVLNDKKIQESNNIDKLALRYTQAKEDIIEIERWPTQLRESKKLNDNYYNHYKLLKDYCAFIDSMRNKEN